MIPQAQVVAWPRTSGEGRLRQSVAVSSLVIALRTEQVRPSNMRNCP